METESSKPGIANFTKTSNSTIARTSTMTMAMHSIMKRSLPCLDLISMASTQSDSDFDANDSCTRYATKKRPQCIVGWDHYRSHEDVDALLSEHQSWRNKKRSRKSEPPITSTGRVKIPFHRRFSSVFEGEVEASSDPELSEVVGESTKRVPQEIFVQNTGRNGRFDESNHSVGAITQDLAMM